MNPLNLVRGDIVLDYKTLPAGMTNPIIDYSNENWWVCVFRPDKQYPAVSDAWCRHFLH